VTGQPTQAQPGSSIENIYISRSVEVAPVFEHELEAIASSSFTASLWQSCSAGLFSFAVGIFVNAVFQDKLTDLAYTLTWRIAPASIVFGVVCFVVALVTGRKGSRTLQEIRGKFSSHQT